MKWAFRGLLLVLVSIAVLLSADVLFLAANLRNILLLAHYFFVAFLAVFAAMLLYSTLPKDWRLAWWSRLRTRRSPQFQLVGFDLRAGSFPISDEMRVGRASSSEIVLYASDVASHHATLRRAKNQVLLRDEDSEGGTFVNGRRLAPLKWSILECGDEVLFGAYSRFRVELQR